MIIGILIWLLGFTEPSFVLLRTNTKHVGLYSEVDTIPSLKKYEIKLNDTSDFTLLLIHDKEENPVHFVGQLRTPVCHTGECLPIALDIYWDLLGNYQKFELPRDRILTKLDHIPFTNSDYEKLQKILSNEYSILKNYNIDELVGGKSIPVEGGIDAVTGATLKTIKNEVVDGAVYTCYTLWHYVHGLIKDRIQEITTSYPHDQLLTLFLNSDHYPYLYWSVDKVVESVSSQIRFLPKVLGLIEDPNIFLGKYVIAHLPLILLSRDSIQNHLLGHYQTIPYVLKKRILDRFKSVEMSDDNLIFLIKLIPDMNRDLLIDALQIVGNQQEISDAAIKKLAQLWENPEFRYRDQVIKTLGEIPLKSSYLLNKLESYQHE